jgi:hypothetical protein
MGDDERPFTVIMFPSVEALLQELEALLVYIPNTCECCPPGGIANHDCNMAWIRNRETDLKVYRDPYFIRGSSEKSLCNCIERIITYTKTRIVMSVKL